MEVIYSKIDDVLDVVRTKLTPDKFEALEGRVEKVSDKGALVAAAVVLISGLVVDMGIRTILVSVIGVFVLGYLGYKFAPACKAAVAANRSQISTRAYLDVLALLMIMAIVGGLVGGLVMVVDGKAQEGLMGIGGSLSLLVLLVYTLHPSMIAIDVDPNTSAGRDVVGLVALFPKGILRTVNVLSAILIISGILLVLWGAIEGDYEGKAHIAAGTSSILGGLGLPAVIFVMFIVVYALIDVYDNILAIKVIERSLGGSADASSPSPTPTPAPSFSSTPSEGFASSDNEVGGDD